MASEPDPRIPSPARQLDLIEYLQKPFGSRRWIALATHAALVEAIGWASAEQECAAEQRVKDGARLLRANEILNRAFERLPLCNDCECDTCANRRHIRKDLIDLAVILTEMGEVVNEDCGDAQNRVQV
jgi:hypothetical protein